MHSISTAQVKEFVTEHLSAIHTLEDVARGLNVSCSTLRRDFLRREKISLHDFIVARRIERMQELLATTDLSCMAICLELGCREDVGARLFKRWTGIRMNQFRAALRSEHGLQLESMQRRTGSEV